MSSVLRNRLVAAAGTGAIGIAGILGRWHEGDGPTVVREGITYHRVHLDTGGVPTVCRGVTGAEEICDKLHTSAECRALETKHLKAAEAAAKRLISVWALLNERQQAAMINFVYNLGVGALEGSTLCKKLNAGDTGGGCRELARWVKSRLKGELITLAGLVDRHGTEQELCEVWGR